MSAPTVSVTADHVKIGISAVPTITEFAYEIYVDPEFLSAVLTLGAAEENYRLALTDGWTDLSDGGETQAAVINRCDEERWEAQQPFRKHVASEVLSPVLAREFADTVRTAVTERWPSPSLRLVHSDRELAATAAMVNNALLPRGTA